MKRVLLLIATIMGLQSCSTEQKTVYWVNSIPQECKEGADKMQCLQVYKGESLDQAKWELLTVPIEGFTFEEGFFRKIEVSEKPLKDTPSLAYTLVRELEKVKDTRFNLQGEWLLSQMGDSTITAEAQPFLKLNVGEMKVNGSDSCNTLMGSIKTLTSKELVFGDVASTLMLCEKMEVADAFGAALKEVCSYELKDGQLLLFNQQGKALLTFKKK